MKVVLKNDEYTIYQRRDGRYAVEARTKAINGDEKVAILVANDLIKAAVPAAPEPVEEAAEEAVAEAEDAAADETEAPAEDAAEEAGDTED